MKLISFILFVRHLMFLLNSTAKKGILQDLYGGEEHRKRGVYELFDLSDHLMTSRYFRTFFYFGGQGFLSKILRVSRIASDFQLAYLYATPINVEPIGKTVLSLVGHNRRKEW